MRVCRQLTRRGHPPKRCRALTLGGVSPVLRSRYRNVEDSTAGGDDELPGKRLRCVVSRAPLLGRIPLPCANLKKGFVVSAELSSVVVLFLTVPEAAKRLGVCRRTLEREIEDGNFPKPVKIRGASRVPSSDLVAYSKKVCRQRAS